jgi:hypothetical protein
MLGTNTTHKQHAMRFRFWIVTLMLFPAALRAQNPGAHLTVDVTVNSVVVRGDTVGVTYVVYNRPSSQDSLFEFIVDAPATVKRIPLPQPDSDYDALGSYQGRPAANWGFLGLLAPSATSTPLYFESKGIPDTVTFWAGGDFPPPDEASGDTLPTDVIKYHSVPGTTVGVKPWPADRTAAALVTRLRNSTQAVCSATLSWITDANLCGQLVSDVDQAETYRANGQVVEARSSLDHFVSLLTGTNGGFASGVTSPAYWLLVSNAGIIRALL